MRPLFRPAVTALALLLSGGMTPQVAAQDLLAQLGQPPAGSYRLDATHGRMHFRVNHLGFSRYMAMFTAFDAQLQFDPDNPAAMTVSAQVEVASLETNYPDPAYDFNALITGPDFLDAAQFPQITFTSTHVALTGARTADVTGDLTLHGVTRPVVLHVTYNGGWGHMPMDPGGARAGFSAETVLNRSDFGITNGIPNAEMPIGVSDAVEVFIEAEFSNPDAPKP